MLIATQEGYLLYKKLGFQTVSSVHKLLTGNYMSIYPAHENQDYEILPLDDNNFISVHELDQYAIGADRKYFLETRIQHSSQRKGWKYYWLWTKYRMTN